MKPIVKWPGGKTKLLHELTDNMPEVFQDYYEPFAGGLAFYLANKDLLTGKTCHVSDLNKDLVLLYNVVAEDPLTLVTLLNQLGEGNSESFYYQTRDWFNLNHNKDITKLSANTKYMLAATFLYLNKAGYNGLCRYNKDGGFNVPFGKKEGPIQLYDIDNLLKVSTALKSADLQYGPYNIWNPQAGDFVYFDPPYHNNFVQYTKQGFTEEAQVQLKQYVDDLTSRGVYIMLSNSATDFIKDLYKDYNQLIIQAPRAISCKANGRNKVAEILIKNY